AELVDTGQEARGRAPVANVAEHGQRMERVQYVKEALHYLWQELQSLLDLVVLRPDRQAGVLRSRERQQELEALLALLEELREQALPTVQKEIQSLAKHLRLELP